MSVGTLGRACDADWRRSARPSRRPRFLGPLVAGLLLAALATGTASAMYMVRREANVPLKLLLDRLHEGLERQPDSYTVHGALAKTHAMAAAWGLLYRQEVRVVGEEEEIVPKVGCRNCANVPYRTVPPPAHEPETWSTPGLKQGKGDEALRAYHRTQAIGHYREAVRLIALQLHRYEARETPPSERGVAASLLDRERLGLGWNLMQVGTPEAVAEARDLFRSIIARAQEGRPRPAFQPDIEAEAIDYLLPLLGEADAQEKARLVERHDQLRHAISFVTPLAVDLRGLTDVEERPSTGAASALLHPSRTASFALGLRGARAWTWPRAGVAWLVSLHGDSADRGFDIHDGSQLFGQSTFGLVHRHGFEALCMLDATGDGWLRDEELHGIALWHDADGSGSSDVSEHLTLEQVGITGLRCSLSAIEKGSGINEQHLVIRGGIETNAGSPADLWDLMLEDRTGDGTEPPCPRELGALLRATSTRR